jgi:hypothetical protein
MRFKFTMLMQLATNISDPTAQPRRIGGWSEGWYFEGATVADLYRFAFGLPGIAAVAVPGLCPSRANLLPTGSAIVGQRVQQIDPVGPSQSLSRLFPGGAATLPDVPQMALLCSTPGLNVKNIRRTILRGIPDARAIEGEYAPSAQFKGDLTTFFTALSQFEFRGVDLAQPTIPIIAIAGDGTIQLAGLSAGFAVNDMVKVLRSHDSFGASIGGKFMVELIGTATSVKVRNWTAGACTGGALRKHAFVYPFVDSLNCTIGRLVTKRVGRPFIQYRGRRSKVR